MGARLKFWQRSRVPKKGSRDEAVEIPLLAASPLVTAPPSNLTRLLYNTASYAGYEKTDPPFEVDHLRTCRPKVYIKTHKTAINWPVAHTGET